MLFVWVHDSAGRKLSLQLVAEMSWSLAVVVRLLVPVFGCATMVAMAVIIADMRVVCGSSVRRLLSGLLAVGSVSWDGWMIG